MVFGRRLRKKTVTVGVSAAAPRSRRLEAPRWRRGEAPGDAFDARFGADFLASVPRAPGVYRFIAEDGEVIYVGKAVRLRDRLRQYRLARRGRKDAKKRAIVGEAARIEWEVCESAEAAELREDALIKALRPRANVANAHSHTYPLFAILRERGSVWLALTSMPGPFDAEGWELHGAWRSRRVATDAFFRLMGLLGYLGHPTPRTRLGPLSRLPYTRVFAFRRLPDGYADAVSTFFAGRAPDFLERLTLDLLESAAARGRASDVRASLTALRRFFEEEVAPLRAMADRLDPPRWPVAQAARDAVAIAARVSRSRSRS
jgi:hypothetical protein